jgi:hypothetical protein
MKTHSGTILTVYLGPLLATPLMGARPKEQPGKANAQTFSGEIMDSLCVIKCAQLGAYF